MRYHINNPRLKERQNKLNERRDLKFKEELSSSLQFISHGVAN